MCVSRLTNRRRGRTRRARSSQRLCRIWSFTNTAARKGGYRLFRRLACIPSAQGVPMRDVHLLAILSLLLLADCAAAPDGDLPTAPTANQSSGLNASSLADSLRRAGLSVRDVGTVEQPFFSVPARVFQVEGRDLQVYEFASAADAASATSQVSPTGSPIGTSMVTWMAPPHFFRKDRLVVNYIGTSETVLTELQRLLGPQFAGR